jgi:dolichol-phosphate mannosyltransferase
MRFRVALVLPMHNEGENVEPLLERVAGVRARSAIDLIALAVDDGSRDGTRARLADAEARYPFLRTVVHGHNQGLAAALRTGIATALAETHPSFDAVAFMDADLTHDPDHLPRLLEPIINDKADFVLGSRYVAGGGMHGVPIVRRTISVIGNAVGRFVLGVPAADLTSGFRAARTAVLRAIALTDPGFGIQLEGSVKAHRAGFRLAEVPVTLGVRRHGYSKMVYNRAFWVGYGGLFFRLALERLNVRPGRAPARDGCRGQQRWPAVRSPGTSPPPASRNRGATPKG